MVKTPCTTSFAILRGGPQSSHNQLQCHGSYLQSELPVPRAGQRQDTGRGDKRALKREQLDVPTAASLGQEALFVDVGWRL